MDLIPRFRDGSKRGKAGFYERTKASRAVCARAHCGNGGQFAAGRNFGVPTGMLYAAFRASGLCEAHQGGGYPLVSPVQSTNGTEWGRQRFILRCNMARVL